MNKQNKQSGQVVIINTLLFFSLSTAIMFAVAYPVVSSFQVTKSFLKSKQAFMVANSASNEAIYKLNANMDLASPETVTLAQGSADITVADAGTTKTITIESDVESYERNYEIVVSQGEGVSFSYGLQAGQGGFEMSGSATINGNAYSNGDIIGSGGGPLITGSAISANVTDPLIITSNNSGVIDPPNQIDFGGNTTPQDLAQSFTVSTSSPITSVRILIKKSGAASMSNITMQINGDNGGKPHKTVLSSATISAATVTTTYGYLTVPLSSTLSLTPGTTYWIVFDTSTNAGQYYSMGANDATYADGVAKTGSWAGSNGGTWSDVSPATLDSYFDVYVGGSTGIVSGVSVGTGGIGDAWAFQVSNVTVSGNLYCQSGTGNNKVCDNSRPDPVQQPYPLSDANIAEWKAIAESGGATSTVSLTGSDGTVSMGPMKINGDLNLGSGAYLNLTGAVYVTGNISVSGNSTVRVDPSLGSQGVVLLADGKISSGGGGQFQGSGTSGSYILLITTSSCPDGAGCSGDNAIEITGGTGAVILNAQNGTAEFSGGASARQATANKIILNGGTSVTYEAGLVNPNFTSGPSGSWVIDSWQEVE